MMDLCLCLLSFFTLVFVYNESLYVSLLFDRKDVCDVCHFTSPWFWRSSSNFFFVLVFDSDFWQVVFLCFCLSFQSLIVTSLHDAVMPKPRRTLKFQVKTFEFDSKKMFMIKMLCFELWKMVLATATNVNVYCLHTK
jgi:hypothetical protein